MSAGDRLINPTNGGYATHEVTNETGDSSGYKQAALLVKQVDDSGNTLGGTGASADQVQGSVAHDAVDSGNPVKIGAKAVSAEQAAVANGDRTNLVSDLTGKLITLPYSAPEDTLDGTGSATNTADTAVIAAQGAGVRIYITTLILSNSSATDTEVAIKSASTTRLTIPAPKTSGAVINFPKPLRLAANEALNFASLASVTTMKVSAVGYKGV